MINAATSLKPAFINYGVRFIQKYENSTHIIRLSDNHRESFDNGVYPYNKILNELVELEICKQINDSYVIDLPKFENLNIRQILLLKAIKKINPSWLRKLRYGTDNLKNLEDDDPSSYQSLKEAGIFEEDLSEDAENLIYELKKIVHFDDTYERNKIELGRLGEKLSMKYELFHTGNKPFHQSIRRENLGFDIISYLPNNIEKKIEVKTCKSSIFYLTINEWETALNSIAQNELYEFHIWRWKNNGWELAIVNPKDIDLPTRTKTRQGHKSPLYEMNLEAFDKYFVSEATLYRDKKLGNKIN